MRAALLILAVCALAAAPAGPSIGDFHLPPKAVFSTAMPRYPNVWFYLDASLAADHQAAVKLVTGELRQALHLRELRLPNSEGCDFEVRLEHFQPWEDSAHRALQHAHSLHMRYYYSDLVRRHLERVEHADKRESEARAAVRVLQHFQLARVPGRQSQYHECRVRAVYDHILQFAKLAARHKDYLLNTFACEAEKARKKTHQAAIKIVDCGIFAAL